MKINLKFSFFESEVLTGDAKVVSSTRRRLARLGQVRVVLDLVALYTL